MLKVIILGGANSIHTIRWANALSDKGCNIILVSMHDLCHKLNPNIRLYKLLFAPPYGYFLNVFLLKKIIKFENPNILNVHYASGYGTLGALSGFKNILLSVWGSDVYDFPAKSILHKKLVKFNLERSKAIASTSHAMLKQTSTISDIKKVFITPFGIDIGKFFNYKNYKTQKITIGTIKTLDTKYGIDTLIRAFFIVRQKFPNVKLELIIAGTGPELINLKRLVLDLKLTEFVYFLGFIPHDKVPDLLNTFDIYVALSRLDSESFGVAILEACACELPVVVSDADGPAEVVIDNVTGFIVPKNNHLAAAEAIIKLVMNDELRYSMGKSGREHVIKKYEWGESLDSMINAYKSISN